MSNGSGTFGLLLLVLFHSCQAGDDAVGNANNYIDEVLQNFRNEPWILSKVEPLEIPDVDEKNFKIRKGTVKGLSSLYRHGDCTLDYENEEILVVAEVAVRNVTVDVKYEAKALFFWIKGHATLRVDDLAVKMVVSMKDGKARLTQFKVIHLGKYKLTKITGVSVVLNWLLKLIANAVAKNSRNKITNALETGVAKAVNDLLSKFAIPDL
ncbi:uncharacterized protein [Parasteatoda tepidariorum]|uniref:uncharacterized protein isoform X2 n=1 Tax=Parasteatoda tepidariorum TaxID=114398 RepID=UPI00077FD4A6|nr:uncharacterized protein LOC107444913 isoform X2 [Parasteatoda tepidariorum]